MAKQTIFLRLTRDYINHKRDKRHKTGFNGLPDHNNPHNLVKIDT